MSDKTTNRSLFREAQMARSSFAQMDDLNRFITTMARVLGLSVKKVEKIMFRGEPGLRNESSSVSRRQPRKKQQ